MSDDLRLEVVELGTLLRVHVHPRGKEAYAMTWSRARAPALLWSPEFKCLYFSTHRGKRRVSKTATVAQIACYERWHDREPSKARIETIQIGKEWQTLGEVRQVDYHSTKWGENEEYTHESRGGSNLYRLGASFYAIQGKMRATARGLVK